MSEGDVDTRIEELKTELERERRRSRGLWLLTVVIVVIGWAGPALSRTTVPYIFSPNTPARASEINANFATLAGAIDDVDASLTQRLQALEARNDSLVPTGAIAFFAADHCPAGWTAHTDAEGRFIVGAHRSGTIGGTVGDAMNDLQNLAHSHTIAHRHEWAHYISGTRTWSSYNSATPGASRITIVDWGSGIGNNSGRFPLEFETGAGSLYTGDPSIASSGAATTSDIAPYLQLLACRKS